MTKIATHETGRAAVNGLDLEYEPAALAQSGVTRAPARSEKRVNGDSASPRAWQGHSRRMGRVRRSRAR